MDTLEGAMKTTADFLDELQKKLAVNSDYAVGKLLGIHRQQLSHYRLLKGAFDDAMCLRVAEILELDSAYVMACMHYQRAKAPEVKRAWAHAAEVLYGLAACLMLVALPALIMMGWNPSHDLAGMVAAVGFVGNSRNLTELYIMRIEYGVDVALLITLIVLLIKAFPWHPPVKIR